MNFYLLEPEVAGGIGKKSIISYLDRNLEGKILDIKYLHYEFDGWLGDDLLASSPCYIISKDMADGILNSSLNGYELQNIEISRSDIFKELYGDKELPDFIRLVPLGSIVIDENIITEWSGQDINISNTLDLVISEKAMDIFKNFKLINCDITILQYL